MDHDTLGLASALSLLGIFRIADLVEMAHSGALVEMLLTAVEQQHLEQRVDEAVRLLDEAAEQRAAQVAEAETTDDMIDVLRILSHSRSNSR